MTKRAAKRLACLSAAWLLKSMDEGWGPYDDLSEADTEKLSAAVEELIDELLGRAGPEAFV
jgi:hypothetical protein